MALSLIQTNAYTRGNRIVFGIDFDGTDLWVCQRRNISVVYFDFKRYASTGGEPIETFTWDSRVQFPDTDGGTNGILSNHVTIRDFSKTPTGFAVGFSVEFNPGPDDLAGGRFESQYDTLWEFTYSGTVATRTAVWQAGHVSEDGPGFRGLRGVDFHDGTWYYLFNDPEAGPDPHFLASAPASDPETETEIAEISDGTTPFAEALRLTRGGDGFYLQDITNGGLRFYDANGAFVETQAGGGSNIKGISYRGGSLVTVDDDNIYIFGAVPVADLPPEKITTIEAFAGDGQITYRITPPSSSLEINGHEISEDGSSGWSNITLDSNNDYVLTGLTNDLEVTRYFRAVSTAGGGPASDAVTATPSATDVVEVPPVTPPDIPVSTRQPQVYGMQPYRALYHIYRRGVSNTDPLILLHSNVEMIRYTRADQRFYSGEGTDYFVISDGFYVPIVPIDGLVHGDFEAIIPSAEAPLTELLPDTEGDIQVDYLQSVLFVGVNRRQILTF